jgi:hypothetical protein
MASTYWGLAPESEIANEVVHKWAAHQRWVTLTGYGEKAQKMYDMFYGDFGISLDSDKTNARMSVNHFKSLIQRLHSITTQSKLQYVPKSRNSDAAAMNESDLAKGLLEYYADEKDMNQVTSRMVELGLVMQDSYVYAPWDKHQGELTVEGETLRNGDQAFYLVNMFDVARHPTLEVSPYYIIKLPVNKYDLAAIYPEKADAITSVSLEYPTFSNGFLNTAFNNNNVGYDDDDTIYVYHLLHDRTPTLPKGRYTLIAGSEVLEDTILPYKTLPVVRFAPGRTEGTVIGDSIATSLYAIQLAIDKLYSSNLTNNLHFNKQSIWSPTSVDISRLSEGYNLILSAQKPEPLQLTNSSPESYKLLAGYEAVMQTISGVNATTRGNPESSLKSGTSLALMLSISVMSADNIQKNYVRAAADLGTIVIHNIQAFATEKRIAYIGGASKKSQAKEFSSKDVMSIDRVTIDIGNPLLSNYAGRQEMIQQWMQFGIVKDPKVIVEFLRTGQIDSITEDDFKDGILIRSENEQLRKGQNPPVMMTDNHPEHIIKHKALANDPEIRLNPDIMAKLLDHIQQHINSMKSIDPDLAAILGLQPLPSQSMPPQPGPNAGIGPEQSGMPSLPNVPSNAPPEAQQALDQAVQPQQGNIA